MAEHDLLEQVARALCIADGREPDALTIADGAHLVEAEFGIALSAPAWTTYAGEARRFIAAATALGLLK